ASPEDHESGSTIVVLANGGANDVNRVTGLKVAFQLPPGYSLPPRSAREWCEDVVSGSARQGRTIPRQASIETIRPKCSRPSARVGSTPNEPPRTPDLAPQRDRLPEFDP